MVGKYSASNKRISRSLFGGEPVRSKSDIFDKVTPGLIFLINQINPSDSNIFYTSIVKLGYVIYLRSSILKVSNKKILDSHISVLACEFLENIYKDSVFDNSSSIALDAYEKYSIFVERRR